MAIYVYDGTTWQLVDRPHVYDGTAWQPVTEAYVYDGTAWRLAYQYDVTAPASSTPTATRVSAGTTMTVGYSSATDSESGVVSVVLMRRYSYNGVFYPSSSGEDRHTVYSGAAVSSVAGGTYADSIASSIRKNPTTNKDYTVQYRLRMTDAAGNVAYTSWSTGVQTKPLGTFTVNATQTSTWETGGTASWRTDTDDVASGFLDPWGTMTGYWFYGSTLQNLCVGYTPNSATIYMERSGNSGTSGNNNISPHTYATRPASGAPTTYMTTNEDTGPNLTGTDASVTYTLPSAWRTLMGAGTMYGVAAVDSGGYRRLKGLGQIANSGQLSIGFT